MFLIQGTAKLSGYRNGLRTPHPPVLRNKLLLFCTLALLLGWLIFLPATAICQDQEKFELIVTYDPQKPYSKAVWEVFEANKTVATKWLKFAEGMEYETPQVLAAKLKVKISTLESNTTLLVIGPATTAEAMALDEDIGEVPARVRFISTSISTSNKFKHIQLSTACLPDEERIRRLHELCPKPWSTLPAAFVGVDDQWGKTLQHVLSNSMTNLCKSLDCHLIQHATVEELGAVADECFERSTPLIFLALDDPAAVSRFFQECHRRSCFTKPYRPIVCLLADYDFSDKDEKAIATQRWAPNFSICMVSEANANTNHNGTNTLETGSLYPDLVKDFVTIANRLDSTNKTSQEFVRELCGFCDGDEEAPEINRPVEIKTSQYFRYKLKYQTAYYSCSLKWLECSWFDNTPMGWSDLSTIASEAPFAYGWEVLRARISWLNSWSLIAIAFVALACGLAAEIHKRFIFVKKDWWGISWRLIVWFLVVMLLFACINYLFVSGLVRINNYPALLVLCLSPLALLPTLQHAALIRIPGLGEVFSLPTRAIEPFLDHCINSQTKSEIRRLTDSVNARVLAEYSGADLHQKEVIYWRLWIAGLLELRDEKRANKIRDRFLESTRICDYTFKSEIRMERLASAIAYTWFVLGKDGDHADIKAASTDSSAATNQPLPQSTTRSELVNVNFVDLNSPTIASKRP